MEGNGDARGPRGRLNLIDGFTLTLRLRVTRLTGAALRCGEIVDVLRLEELGRSGEDAVSAPDRGMQPIPPITR